jgi:hypothetical protein
MEQRYSNTLVSSREDKKLVYADNVFDTTLSKHQDEINEALTSIINKLKDIQDNLQSTDTDKPLSANQGRLLKQLIEAKVIQVQGAIWDAEPTEGNIDHIVSSDILYSKFKKIDDSTVYLTEDEYNELVNQGAIKEDVAYYVYED